jgi:hypothetical protein
MEEDLETVEKLYAEGKLDEIIEKHTSSSY